MLLSFLQGEGATPHNLRLFVDSSAAGLNAAFQVGVVQTADHISELLQYSCLASSNFIFRLGAYGTNDILYRVLGEDTKPG